MSVLVHGEEKRESVVRELHGVGLEHREARAVRHDDVVGGAQLAASNYEANETASAASSNDQPSESCYRPRSPFRCSLEYPTGPVQLA